MNSEADSTSSSLGIVIIGGGPIGLILALQLSRFNVPSVVLERYPTSTHWPKMDITNCRSMELFRKMGLADEIRSIGVPPEFSFDVIFATGLAHQDKELGHWDLPSVNGCIARNTAHNNGITSLEPYQRLSQAVLEKRLRELCRADPLINFREGVKVVECRQIDAERIETSCESIFATGTETFTLTSRYVAGCDGANSIVRRCNDISLVEDTEVVGIPRHLVHFQSRDLKNIHRYGQFWHIFFPHAGSIISQDEVDHFTCNQNVPADAIPEGQATPEGVLRMILNTDIKVDKVLLFNRWKPVFAVADHFRKDNVFLCGDACHLWNPTGGYGFNTGVGDAYDLGWKLALSLRTKTGPKFFTSYEIERKPIATRCMKRSQRHTKVHKDGMQLATLEEMRNSSEVQSRMKNFYDTHRGENEDLGIELGQRLYESPVVCQETASREPRWNEQQYFPSTWPGCRVPSLYLDDGSQLFDLFGRMFTLVDFQPQVSTEVNEFLKMADQYGLELRHVHLPNQIHVHRIWESPLVLVRPDFYSAWRGQDVKNPKEIIETILGFR